MSWKEYLSHVSKKDINERVLDNFLASFKKDCALFRYRAGWLVESMWGNQYHSNHEFLYGPKRISYAQYLLQFPGGVHQRKFPEEPIDEDYEQEPIYADDGPIYEDN